jgi:hypothetical protein
LRLRWYSFSVLVEYFEQPLLSVPEWKYAFDVLEQHLVVSVPSNPCGGVSARSMGKWNSRPFAANNLEMLVPSTGDAFQLYRAKNNLITHWSRDSQSAWWIIWTLLRYQWNLLFRMALWSSFATRWKGTPILVHISVSAPANSLPASTMTSLGSPFGMKNDENAALAIVF